MRPALKPGLLPVWRNRDTMQIGIDHRRAIALTGMRGTGGLLRLLDGSRDRVQVLSAARELGIDPAAADRIMSLLAAGGALDDIPASTYDTLPAALRARLAPELAAASIAHGDGDGGARTLARRRAACVRVHGASRAGLSIAALLTSAGIGLVISAGPATARQPDARLDLPAPPPGLPADAAAASAPVGPGAPQSLEARPGQGPSAQAQAGQARSGQTRSGQTRSGHAGRARPRRPSLVILADSHRRELPAVLCRDQVPHLAVSASEAIGVVGPLVLPGRSACLRCLDLTRAERDPAWPLILAQLAGHAATSPVACDAVLTAMVAAQAAAQALAFIDRGPAAPAVVSGTLELVLPGWQWRRRTWRPHPECGCRR
jgi:bacteriocin biosynthesis cyclodehydratase domain-containing protein